MLCIKDALELYSLVGKHIPHKIDEDFLDFTGKIIHSIRTSDEPEVFGQSLLLMFPDVDIETLSKNNPLENVELFIKGLSENKILNLIAFCEAIGYGR